MYNLSYFKAEHPHEVMDFMKAHPFVTLCGVAENGQPVATQVPVLFAERDGKLYLQAHIMRKTDHCTAFENNNQVLAIFTGPHSYVSASWYTKKDVASTWNYQSVQVRGSLQFGGDEMLHQMLTNLTNHFENDPHSPSLVSQMPSDYVHNLMKAIVAFEIEVTDIAHVFKLSQNHSAQNKQSIVQHLDKSDDVSSQQMAAVMKKYNHL